MEKVSLEKIAGGALQEQFAKFLNIEPEKLYALLSNDF